MGTLRVLSRQGDYNVTWDEKQVEAGSLEALEAIREAERIFEEQRRSGATPFLVATGALVKKLKRFDPKAEQIIMVPRVVGG